MAQIKRLFPEATTEPSREVEGKSVLAWQQPGAKVADSELLIRKAFEEDQSQGIAILFQHYYQPLCSHAVRFVSSKEIAEDIVSDLFYEFHARQLYLTIAVSYRAFLFTAVRNRAFDYVKSEMGRSTSLDNAAWLPLRADQQPDTITQFEELCRYVEEAINAMPAKRRQVYLMHRFDGKKYAEIAAELNLSARTVEVHMYRAIHHVRELVKDRWLLLALCVTKAADGLFY